ncbi:MAG: mechanosensitive ion channel family protein [Chrysiogenetes bacterium]|nr:mechanosensitive ion channel family protein [Chrysiogenetes bacterium]
MEEELETVKHLSEKLIDFGVQYGVQVFGALIILLLGVLISKWCGRIVTDFLEKKNVDVTLTRFIGSTSRIAVFSLFLIISLGKFGITLAPLIAALGAVAFGATFALQGLFANYAAGLALILTRPFKVGDTIVVQGASGVVDEIKLAATILSTEDQETITIPNKMVIGEMMQNSYANRIVELTVGVDYGDDPAVAADAIVKALREQELVVKEPPPQAGIEGFGESSIDIAVRYWLPTRRYFEGRGSANLAIWNAVCAAGITIPYPHRDVLTREEKKQA